ncbi:hypothetical protein NCC49_002562 [Naganishia albida]|nr:hypothetical protein NCC49_002562 [Naganishia albida]
MGQKPLDKKEKKELRLIREAKLARIAKKSASALGVPLDVLNAAAQREAVDLHIKKMQAEKNAAGPGAESRIVPHPPLPTQSAPKTTAVARTELSGIFAAESKSQSSSATVVSAPSGSRYRVLSGSGSKGKAAVKEARRTTLALGKTGNMVVYSEDTEYFRNGERPFDSLRDVARVQMRWLVKEGYMVQIAVYDDSSPGEIVD